MTSMTNLRKRADKQLAKLRASTKALKKEKRERKKSRQGLAACTEAVQILQRIAQNVQQKAHTQIATVVSRCLESVFDEPYEFCITFDRKRGRTEAVLTFVRNGEGIDPLTAAGGGVVDVAAFALRLSCLSLSRPSPRQLVVLDEPFKFVSAEYRDRVRMMLDQLSKEMGVQFVMVTHIPELQIGTTIKL